jgi:TonB family protein
VPVPDEHGVYSLGPGIKSPVRISFSRAGPADAIAPCRHPTVVSAVVNVDGTLKVRGVYQPDDQACDKLAIAAIEESRVRPATLNGEPVPVLVCLGVPFASRLAPPVARPTACPYNLGATPLGNTDTFEPRPGTKPPVAIYSPSPEYSREARKKKIQGDVTVSTIIDEEGRPTKVHLEKGIGYGLDENALEAVRRYRFQPATTNGKPVAARMTIEVKFRFDEN